MVGLVGVPSAHDLVSIRMVLRVEGHARILVRVGATNMGRPGQVSCDVGLVDGAETGPAEAFRGRSTEDAAELPDEHLRPHDEVRSRRQVKEMLVVWAQSAVPVRAARFMACTRLRKDVLGHPVRAKEPVSGPRANFADALSLRELLIWDDALLLKLFEVWCCHGVERHLGVGMSL